MKRKTEKDYHNLAESRGFNGVCLCEKCHKEFHHIYGYRDNTKEQFEKFKLTYQ